MPNRCYHLFHNREVPNMNEYQRNLNLLNQYNNLSKDDLWKTIIKELPKSGMKNKYDEY